MKFHISYAQAFDTIKAAVEDRGNSALELVAALTEERDLEIKGPAIAALAAWGKDGLQRIVQICLEQDSSKTTSTSLKVLSAIASDTPLKDVMLFFLDRNLSVFISDTVSGLGLRNEARESLNSLVSDTDSSDLLIPLGTTFMSLAFEGSGVLTEIVNALSTKWLHYSPRVLSSYRSLIEDHPADEPKFHSFFEAYPQMLDPMAIQTWSKPDFHGLLEPDFLIRRTDDTYLVVEIECPGKTLITRGCQLSAEATHAEKQVVEYRDFLNERLAEARNHFPKIRDIECLAVIGLQSSLNAEQKIALHRVNSNRHKVRTVGFDWLEDRARSIFANISMASPQLVERYRYV